MPSHIVPCCVMSRRLMCVVSCHVEGCLRHFVSCHVAFCRVLSCHVVVPKRRVCGSFFCSRICQSHSTTHEAASCCLSKKILCTSWAGPTSKTQWKVRLCGQSPSATTSSAEAPHKKKPSNVQEPHHLEDPAGHVTPCQASLSSTCQGAHESVLRPTNDIKIETILGSECVLVEERLTHKRCL